MSNNIEKVITEEEEEEDYEDEEDYCLGCDSGLDSCDAHNESCNMRLYLEGYEGYEGYEGHEGHEDVSSTPEPRRD